MKSSHLHTFILLLIMSSSAISQVKKSIIVEHFTNSRCSVCASRNPGFYTALAKKSDVIHIAYHPSSPYSTCLFSTQNKVENDARTNFYGVYGGTPTFSINGDIKSSSDVQNVAIYNSYDNQTSPLSIVVSLSPVGNDSIGVSVSVRAESQHNLTNLQLYVPMAEDTVFYNSPNGEKQHYDVFRKSFNGTNPITFVAPKLGAPDYIYKSKVAKNALWSLKRLSALAIISDSDLSVVQAAQSTLFNPNIVSTTSEEGQVQVQISVFPNPTSHTLHVNVDNLLIGGQYYIYNTQGVTVQSGTISSSQLKIDVAQFAKGTYILTVSHKDQKVSEVFSKVD